MPTRIPMKGELNSQGFSPTDTKTRRTDSWTRKIMEEVILFDEANDDLSLVPIDQFKDKHYNGQRVHVPRWSNTKAIYVKSEDGNSQRYVATVKLGRLGRRQKVKRLLGTVKSMYVFDSAIPRMSLVR
ncbi:MAG: hypothetical protein M1816_004290 [Peltula sp. TS41687]|nr:MAG: hypothetical protein M1816_004290 [Peltula sp. TS41687]